MAKNGATSKANTAGDHLKASNLYNLCLVWPSPPSLPLPGLDCDRTEVNWSTSSASTCTLLRTDRFIRRVWSSINIPEILTNPKNKNKYGKYESSCLTSQKEQKQKSQRLHGVVEVVDLARRLPRCRIAQTRIVKVADQSLEPGQRASRWHGFVWIVTYKSRRLFSFPQNNPSSFIKHTWSNVTTARTHIGLCETADWWCAPTPVWRRETEATPPPQPAAPAHSMKRSDFFWNTSCVTCLTHSVLRS